MKLLVFGGTSDARRLIQRISDQHQVTFCVVSDYARHLLPEESEQLQILVGPKDAAAIEELMLSHDLVIDATHPYAESIHQTLERVVPTEKYRRLIRPLPVTEGFRDYTEMVDYLVDRPGNILLTTGMRSAEAFKDLAERAWLRLLPDPKNLQAVIDVGFSPSHLIAMQGPFSEQLNRALLEDLEIQFLVTKASGQAGGYAEKVAAAESLGVELLVLQPPQAEGLSLEELLEELEQI